jgi:flagellar biosynthesis/type III secretory pathway chaperone
MTARATVHKLAPQALEAEPAARALLAALGTLHGLLKQLVEVAGQKLTALRRADSPGLNECTKRELALLQQVYQAEQERNATVARLAQALQCPELRAGPLRLLVARVAEPLHSHLQAKMAGLREVAAALRQKNEVAGRVAHDLQVHIRGIFAELAKAQQETVGYGPAGQQRATAARVMVDALG